MIQYLIYIVIFQLLFLVAYDLFHKKDTFFSLNRAYLLCTSLLSLILPFIKIDGIRQNIPEEYVVNLPAVIVGQEPIQIENQDTIQSIITSPFLESINWLLLVYLAGIIVAFLFFIQKNIKLYLLRKQSTLGKIDGYNLITIPKSKDAFSFWNTIYLGDQITPDEKEQIIIHEIVHLQERHSIDLLWFEILKIVFWFNPLVYVFQSRLNTLHEFIADAKSINVLGKQKYYEQLLNTVFDTEKIQFINQFFNQSLLKKRIQMLQKSKSKAIVKFKYLALLPILLVMIVFSSFSEKESGLTDVMDTSFKKDKLEGDKEKESLFRADKTLTQKLEEDIEQSDEESGTSLKEESIAKEELKTKPEIVEKNQELIQEKSKKTSADSTKKEIAFDKIDKVPTTQTCKDITDNIEMKKCVSKEINDFVNNNFNVAEIRKYGKPDMNRIYVRFKIDTTGLIKNIQTRASAPELKAETKRVIELLPPMIPGEVNGEKVVVLYTLPIVFYNPVSKEQKQTEPQDQKPEKPVLTETLPEDINHDIEFGYYLITNIFKSKSRFEKMLKNLNNVGLPAKGFENPKDGYFYVYLGKYNKLSKAREMLFNKMNGRYHGDVYILKVQNEK